MCKSLFGFGVVAGVMATNAAWLGPSVAKRGGADDLLGLMLMTVVSIVCAAIGLYGAAIEDENRNDKDKKE